MFPLPKYKIKNILLSWRDLSDFTYKIPIFRCSIKKILFIFIERGRKGEREREKHWPVASCTPPTGDSALTGNQTRDLWFTG